MIVYYDILLLDDESLLGVRHSQRFKILSSLVECQRGWAELVQREVIDFGHSLAASNLRKAFAKTIVDKREGLVLKPDEPYFDVSKPGRPWSGQCIKLKKEYIGNFGDVGDFAVVGAGYDPAKAKHYNIPSLKWTHFYIGCLDNREEVMRWSAKPEFTVVNVVELNETQLKSVVQFANPILVSRDKNEEIKLSFAPGVEIGPRMSVIFTNPMVFDLRCFSFERGGSTGFYSLRFPMVSKVHFDRDFTDTFSFEQLQDTAKEAIEAPELPDSQETLQWIARLEAADPRGFAVDTVSQQTATTMPTPSPCRPTQSDSRSWPQSPLAAKSAAPQPNTGPPRDVASGFVPPMLPMITPSTPSAPTEQYPKQRLHNGSQKRRSPSSSKESQGRKKRKSAEQHQSSSSSSQRLNTSQVRQPLGEIDVNSSQHSITSVPMNSQPAKEHKAAPPYKVIDLTSSPEVSFQTAVAEMDPSQTAGGSSQESDEISVCPPDYDGRNEQGRTSPPPSQNPSQSAEEPECPCSSSSCRTGGSFRSTVTEIDPSQTTSGSSQESEEIIVFPSGYGGYYKQDRKSPSSQNSTARSAEDPEFPSSSGNGRTGCIHAGSQCQFTKMTMLLAPHLSDPPSRLSALLNTHGIDDAVLDIKAWMTDPHRRVDHDAALLVDSIDQPEAMKALLKLMENYRKDAAPSRCYEIVTVYDWRVLEYITIMEDDNITRKYYDGFRDPWRRWYCGLV